MNNDIKKIDNERWINLEHLPKHKSGSHIGRINWEESINHKISFYYKGIEGEILITEYYLKRKNNRNRFYLKVQYKQDNPIEISIDNIYRCRLREVLYPYLYPYEYKLGSIVNELEILDYTHIINNNKKYRAYKYMCKHCNHIGKAYEQEMGTKKCPKCGDGISYGEKFIYAILLSTGNEFETQHIFNWSKGKKNGLGKKIYDFYVPSKNCIIEVHGIQHYPECNQDFRIFQGKTSEDEVENDKIKKDLALLNGIDEKNYIVIDCRISEFEYIKNSILNNNKFRELFNIQEIDRKLVEDITMTNFRKKSIELYKKGFYIKDISRIIKISEKTIMRFLKKSASTHEYIYMCDKDRLEKEKREEVLTLFNNGNSRKYISEKTGVCYTSVNKILKQFKDEGKCEYNTQTEQRVENYKKAASLYKLGLNEKEISVKMKIDDGTAVRYLIKAREEGICKNYLTKSEIYEKKIKDSSALYNEGKTPREIEKILGINNDRIYTYLIKGSELGLCNYKRQDEIYYEKMNEICHLFNNGFRVMEITRKLNITKGTVRKYLKKGNQEGLCIYPRIKENINNKK